MGNLLSAGMYRLVRSKLAWLLLLIMVVLTSGIFLQTFRLNQENLAAPGFVPSTLHPLDNYFFGYSMLQIVSMAVFCPLFLSSEYGDGTLRNKLIVGHSPIQVYLGNLNVNCLFAVISCLTGIFCGMCVGVPMLGWFQEAGTEYIAFCMLISLTLSLVCTAIYTLITMVVPNRGIAVTVCVLLAFGMIFWGQSLALKLSQPEFQRSISVADGGYMYSDSIPNPAFVSGIQRQIYQFFYNLIPGGQAYQILAMELESPIQILAYNILTFTTSTLLGLALFRRKDIK